MSFRREKYIPKGGPDGGDGGKGGSVLFEASETVDTLLDFSGRSRWTAANGGDGEGSNRHGSKGRDLVIKVPVGTMIFDAELDLMLKDMSKPGMKICICRGGDGGKGNKRFATSTNQAPRITTPGKPGQERNLKLELKLIADAGLLGVPNAGKSTLVSRCSAAKPKIADYPFTTLEPVLGIVQMSGYRRFVMADIPGLIEGAHNGTGLGYKFLRHIERTTILLHILDVMPFDGSDPVDNYNAIRNELELYSGKLAQKKEIIVINKIDMDQDGNRLKDIQQRLNKEVFPISAVTGENIQQLCEIIWKELKG